jgi:SAM-dependent methyltransferase
LVTEVTNERLLDPGSALRLNCAEATGMNHESHTAIAGGADQAHGAAPTDRAAALQQYRARADIYDAELLFATPIRRRAIDKLALRPGDTVLDVGCGTGLSLPLIERAIGPGGRIFGIEQSAEMLARARSRIASNRYRNVTLIQSPVEEAKIPSRADAVLFHFTHDVLRTPAAVANVAGAFKPGARVVAAGLKWAPRWAVGVNLAVLLGALRSTTALEGLDRPWSHLEAHLRRVKVEQLLGGAIYLMSGVAK